MYYGVMVGVEEGICSVGYASGRPSGVGVCLNDLSVIPYFPGCNGLQVEHLEAILCLCSVLSALT